jgi:L-threonylcarbamoyladenylate synthase
MDTIGVRIPVHPVAQKLLSGLPFPLAAPSANVSTRLSPTTAESVLANFADSRGLFQTSSRAPQELLQELPVDKSEHLIILDGNQCLLGVESTILDLTGDIPRILRLGAVSAEEISSKCGLIFAAIEMAVTAENAAAENVAKFYGLKKPVIMNNCRTSSADALLAFGPIPAGHCFKHMLNLSQLKDLNEAAANLFSMLSELDNTDAKRICVMPIPDIGIGKTINNRLKMASKQR